MKNFKVGKIIIKGELPTKPKTCPVCKRKTLNLNAVNLFGFGSKEPIKIIQLNWECSTCWTICEAIE